ncbi:glycosyltransferase [Candidatus Microgenomates bacterium]|nr:MAG: glycosyltransferase [Candidatus Microgenomates bacterium]
MKSAKPLRYSFIIPTLNEGGYIGACIESIKLQPGDDFEIIVADNGSTDKTVALAKLAGARVISVSQKGLSHARNQGAKVAYGEYVCFIDADGRMSKNWLVHARKLVTEKDLDFVSGLTVFHHSKWYKSIWFNVYTLLAYSFVWICDRVFKKPPIVGNNLVIRKRLLEKLGGFPAVVAEDVYLTRKLWQESGSRGTFAPTMIIYYSSRGFEATGYLQTILYWLRAIHTPTSQENYAYNSKR